MAAVDVAADLRRRIASGEYPPGGQLPTIGELVDMYGVARATIDRALRELAAAGLVVTEQGRGTYVRERVVVHRNLADGLEIEFRRALAGDVSQGIFEAMTGTPAGNVHVDPTYTTLPADKTVAVQLGVAVGTPLLRRTFRTVLRGTPFQISHSYMSVDLAARAGLASADVERPGVSTLLHLLNAGVTVQDARFTIESRMPDPAESEDLAIPPGTPVVEVWRVLKVDGRPVEASVGVIRSDMVGYYFDVDLEGIEP